MHDPESDEMFATMRRKAESLATDAQPAQTAALSDTELARLVHELRVNQIELELQNEELRRTQTELAQTRDRYANLYDFAPAGYFTLDTRGVIRSTARPRSPAPARPRSSIWRSHTDAHFS